MGHSPHRAHCLLPLGAEGCTVNCFSVLWTHRRGAQRFQPPALLVPQIELAILKFPYDSWGTPFQQLKQVVDEESPQLPADRFSPEFVDFISQW